MTTARVTRRMFTLEQVEAAMEELGGFCLACGEEASGVDPDARGDRCEACGQPSVAGAEEIILMGRVDPGCF